MVPAAKALSLPRAAAGNTWQTQAGLKFGHLFGATLPVLLFFAFPGLSALSAPCSGCQFGNANCDFGAGCVGNIVHSKNSPCSGHTTSGTRKSPGLLSELTEELQTPGFGGFFF